MSARAILLNILSEFRKGKCTKISDLTDSMKINKKECIDSLYLVASQLNDIGYMLIPGHTGRVDANEKLLCQEATTTEYTHRSDSFKKCDFVYVIKANESSEEENKFINEYISEIVYVYTVLYLNASEIEYERVANMLLQIGGSEEGLKHIINRKYFIKKKRNNEYFLRPGWKFYLEFPNFSVQEYIASLKAASL